jgi:hypothetical protein
MTNFHTFYEVFSDVSISLKNLENKLKKNQKLRNDCAYVLLLMPNFPPITNQKLRRGHFCGD